MLEAQQVSRLPPPLDELLRVAGAEGRGRLLSELLENSGAGWETMLDAKEHARTTAEIAGAPEEFGPDRAVFLSDPGGTVFWVDPDGLDPPVWALTERSNRAALAHARLASWLELEVVRVETART